MFAFFFLQATEIYGIIDEDTTIGPEGNPWCVTHNLTVNEDATLTILPGTEIYVTAAYTDDFYNFVANNSGEAEAKVITIYGNILAIGTEADSILFTRSPDYPHFRWGGIRLLSDCPELNTFKHSIIEYTAFVYDNIGVPPLGIASKPGITIENCYFQDNAIGIQLFDLENIIYYPTKINGCYFYTTDESIIFETGNDTGIQLFINDSDVMTQISNCYFNKTGIDAGNGINNIINCTFRNIEGPFGLEITNNHDFYGNEVINLTSSWLNGINSHWTEKGVFRKNHIHRINCGNAMRLESSGFIEVSGNNFSYLNLTMNMSPDSRFYNNTSEYSSMVYNCNWDSAGTQNIYNNFMCESSFNFVGNGNCNFYNNVTVGNDVHNGVWLNEDNTFSFCYNNYIDKWSIYATSWYNDVSIKHINNIYNDRENYVEEHFEREPAYLFFNNFLTYDIPEFVTDCGGNLEGMDIALAGVIIDTLNHSFALSDSSLCIDAGYANHTFCNWDYHYNYSPFDGDGDGVAIVDIGPVEYGSYFTIGYVKCTVTDPEGVPLDIIRGEVLGECVEYTGLEGNFVMELPAGIYTLHLTSPFYENDSLFVAVNAADTCYVNMSLQATYPFVKIDKDELPQVAGISDVLAYPNPFNPEVTISFSTTESTEDTEISIYNVKGQLLRSLKIHNSQFKINQVVWDGNDERGRQVATGVYLFRIKAGKEEVSAKMLFLK
jgi:hypothetical protein